MTTPNGHEDHEPNGSGEQATSTVLALDGWGPVMPEPVTNGANGAQPELEPQAEAAPPVDEIVSEPDPTTSLRDRISASFAEVRSRPTPAVQIDGQLIRILASAAAMTVAVLLAVRFGETLRSSMAPAPQPKPTPVTGLDDIRRKLALTIDPTLTPKPRTALSTRSLPSWRLSR